MSRPAVLAPAPGWLAWTRSHPTSTVIAGYLAIRLSDIIAFAVLAAHAGESLGTVLWSWDGGWFLRAATIGWPEQVDVAVADGSPPGQTTWAWPPVFPLLGRTLAAPLGATALPWVLVSLATIGGLIAAVVLARTVRPYVGPAAAAAVALLWASMPASPVLVMAYSEGVFCALAFAALLALTRGRFLLAGLAVLLAGLTRLSVAPFAITVVVVAVASWRGRSGARLGGGRLLTVILLCGAGVLAWPIAVAVRAMSWDALGRLQATWGRSTVPLVDTVSWLLRPGRAGWPEVALTATVVVAAGIAAVSVWRDRRYPLPIRLIGPLSLASVVGTGVGLSAVRLLLPDVAVPAWLQRRMPAGRTGRVSAAVVAVGLALLTLRWLWIGVYVGGPTGGPPP